jgi:class 3 adenylate cyclase/predicted Ser/Thr protein kinase
MAPAAKLAEAVTEEATIMVTDLRGLAVESGDPAAVIQRIAWAMQLQEREVRRQEGTVRQIVGHRLVCSFTGDRSVLHAVRAARTISEELATNATAGEQLGIGVGVATGEFVSGGIALKHESGLALAGNAPLLALLFAWEAPTSVAFVSSESSQNLGPELMKNATREEVRLRWLPAPVVAYAVPLQDITTSTTMRGVSGMSVSGMATLRMDDPSMATPSTIGGGAGKELVPGQVFANRYSIEQIVGRGGMGVVYRATDKQLDETVALKTLPGDSLSRSPEELERFKREIRLARQITHRNVLRTFDYGEADGVYFISMEYVRGYTLAELLEETPRMAIRPAMGIARQICRGLQAAHEEGIIHRDIKPQNVLVDQKGQVKIMDFGIARRAEAAEAMTSAGIIVGTPHYMSPEQVQGKNLDSRSDIYSMGVMMYEMLCGVKPFDSDSLMGVLTAHLTEKVRPPVELRPEIGSDINRIILRCLEKTAGPRFADAGELLDALDRLQGSAAAVAA